MRADSLPWRCVCPHPCPFSAPAVRIAFVVHDYNRAFGHSRYVTELAERFARNHDVHVFANRFEGVAQGIQTHTVPALRTSALTTILSFAISASHMVGRRFDIVHAQGFSIPRADVVTAHISNARWQERRAHLERRRLPWQEQLFGALVTPLERRAVRDPNTTVIAVSAALRDDLAALYGRSDAVVVHHGVDGRQFNPETRDRWRASARRDLGVPDDVVLFLYVGDLRKGFASAIRALRHVPAARLLGISRSDGSRYLELAKSEDVGDRVCTRPFTGAIERAYAAADVFVFPTPYDAFGMVLTEAMACGVPVITTPHAGAAELVTAGVHGLIVPDATAVGALSDAMRALAADRSARERMGRAAADMMRTNSWDHVAQKTLAVYERHLAGRKPC